MRIIEKFKLYYHTIKTLKLEQIYYRLKYRIFPLKSVSIINKGIFNTPDWNFFAPPYQSQSFLSENKVELLNKSAVIKSSEDWNSPCREKLWLYNLHYFDDLNAKDCDDRIELQRSFIHRWIDENPPVEGNGWESYPISLRLVNWIKWYQRNQIKDSLIIESMLVQSCTLLKRLEYHILGNHLFANGKALVFFGAIQDCGNSNVFLKKGLEILDQEITEQFLSDGGHFELSPMYHSILLWDLLDLINLAVSSNQPDLLKRVINWKSHASKALTFLRCMCHPDGEISFFNDAAFKIAPPSKVIFTYAKQLGINWNSKQTSKLVSLGESGYSRVESGDFTLIFDHALVGPDYLPGHAHADTLSVEVSVGKSRVLVNSGTSIYGQSFERARQRSTGAHNTVEINESNSSEVWGGFRVARRANIVDFSSRDNGDTVNITASHDGYSRLAKGLIHKRSCNVYFDFIEFIDEIEGRYETAKAYFHLHPRICVEKLNDNEACLSLDNGKEILFSCDHVFSFEPSTWHPEFGTSVPNQRIVIKTTDSRIISKFVLR